MSFLRHVGKMGDRKVAIVFRQLPSEEHMCLVTYTETLNMHIHDPMMKCIESEIGQSSPNLADALNRTYTKDGRIILQVLHSEGLLKKVQTSQVMATPNSTTKLRLDELNNILNEMGKGEEAVKRLAELDNSRGLQDPADVARRMRGQNKPPAPVQESADNVFSDTALAQQRLQQADRMEKEATGLLAEAKRLKEEAVSMDPSLGKKSTTASLDSNLNANSSTAKKRGRPAKAKVLV